MGRSRCIKKLWVSVGDFLQGRRDADKNVGQQKWHGHLSEAFIRNEKHQFTNDCYLIKQDGTGIEAALCINGGTELIVTTHYKTDSCNFYGTEN
ncbi:unnamed protein product [Caenorhabditis brenneri]